MVKFRLIINDFGFTSSVDFPFVVNQNLHLIYDKCVYILVIFAVIMTYGYNEELNSKISFIKYHKKNLDLKKDGEIFNNLVPEFIQGRMKNNAQKDVIVYELVTIVFCDISDFDKLNAKLSPKDLINLLDKIYNTFDQLCTLHGIQKIETVGKTYMAAGGLRDCEKDMDSTILSKHHAVRIFEMAVDMVDIMQRMTLENGEIVMIKIGIHTGKVIPAVVGNHKPQFSLIGDTVNTSARMCSYSKELCIMSSEFAYEHISKHYLDFIQTEQFVKGKGNMKLYLYNPGKNKSNIFDSKVKTLKETTWLIRNTTLRQQQTLKSNAPIISNNLVANKLIENNIIKEEKKEEVERMKNSFNTNLNMNNLSISNQSVFIFENSLDMPEKQEKNTVIRLTDKHPKKKLSKKMISFNTENFLSKKDSVGENFIYNDSYFFLNFKDPKEDEENEKSDQDKDKEIKNSSSEIYERYLKLKFVKSMDYYLIVNFIFCLAQILQVYNLASYNNAFPHFIVFNSIKFGLVMVNVIIMATSNSLREEIKIYKLVVSSIYLFFTIINQVQLNYVVQYFYVNLILEQHLILLITCFNG